MTDVAGPGVVLGCDIARFGRDESVVAVAQGPRVLRLVSWNGRDLMETTGRIVALAREHDAEKIRVDEIGLGGGVVDRLSELGLPVEGINVGEAANNPEKYINRRAEIYDALAIRFREGGIAIPPDDELVGQLASIRYRFDSRGRMIIESKDEARKRGVPSPDRAEALMLCYAPARPKPRRVEQFEPFTFYSG